MIQGRNNRQEIYSCEVDMQAHVVWRKRKYIANNI